MPLKDTAIVLFAYKRPAHVRKVLDSIVATEGINQYHLIVFQDGPKNSSEKLDVNKTTEVLTRYKSNFASTEFFFSNSNQGLAKSVISGLNYAFEKFNKCIILEDDIVVGPQFISYLQRNLDEHEKSFEIGSVSGFQLVNRYWRKKTNLYLSPRHTSWGWGTWKRIWEKVDWDILDDNCWQVNAIDKRIAEAGDDLLGMIKLANANQIDSWSVIFDLNMIVQGLLCVHPVQQYCRNIGMDGTGTHYSDTTYENPYINLAATQGDESSLTSTKRSYFYDIQLRWKFSKRNIKYISILRIILGRLRRR